MRTDQRSTMFGPAVLLGVGLGGFVDGIVLHQLLRWHHLLSATDAGLETNIVADGLFHAGTWVATVAGLFWLWSRVRADRQPIQDALSYSWSVLAGGLLLGWGAFNLVEGLVNHQLLGLHHVRHGAGQLWYDLGFLLLGAVLVVAGWFTARSARRQV